MAEYIDFSSTPYLLTDKGNFKITELSGQPEDEIWLEYQELWRKIVYLSFGLSSSELKTRDSDGQG